MSVLCPKESRIPQDTTTRGDYRSRRRGFKLVAGVLILIPARVDFVSDGV